MYVRDYVIEHARLMIRKGNEARQEELEKLLPRIPVSQIGHCPRQAIFEAARYHPDHPLHTEITHPFTDYVTEVMQCGNVWEHETTRALALGLGDKVHWAKSDPVLHVGDEAWSGHIDYLVEPCEEYPAGAIIEHKATNPVNFVRTDKLPDGSRRPRLPYPFHCLQVLVYERLYRKQHGLSHALPTWLYYRSWNNWAEIEVWSDGRYLVWDGDMNGREVSGEFEMEYTLDTQMSMLEGYWGTGTLPPRYETPFTEDFTCAWRDTKKGIARPNCRYFGVCWPDLPQESEPTALEHWK